MKPNHHRDSVRSAGSQSVSVRFEVAPPTAIPIQVASTGNDWHRMAAFMPTPFGGRTPQPVWRENQVGNPEENDMLRTIKGCY